MGIPSQHCLKIFAMGFLNKFHVKHVDKYLQIGLNFEQTQIQFYVNSVQNSNPILKPRDHEKVFVVPGILPGPVADRRRWRLPHLLHIRMRVLQGRRALSLAAPCGRLGVRELLAPPLQPPPRHCYHHRCMHYDHYYCCCWRW